MAAEQTAQSEPDAVTRGVKNPRVIDLIQPVGDQLVELVMFEERPWAESRDGLDDIQEKFNNYLDYVLDGHFLGQFEQYVDFKVRFALRYSNPLTGTAKELLDAMNDYMRSAGLEFLIEQRPQAEIEEALALR